MNNELALVDAAAPPLRRDTFGGREQTLAKLEQASALLLEVQRVQDAKQIHDVAKAARVYAREQKLGHEVVLKARGVAYEALRRIGDLLHQTERAQGGQPYQEGSTPSESGGVERIPTIAELGLDYKTSSIAQQLHALPPEHFAAVREGRMTLNQALAYERCAAQMILHAREESNLYDPTAIDLRVCSCADLFASGIRPDVVITEPPHERDQLQAFSELARASVEVPVVVVKVETYYLPDVLARLCAHLTYRGAVPVGALELKGCRLILVFCRDEDVRTRFGAHKKARFELIDDSREWHEYFVRLLTEPGELVCDPFPRIPDERHGDYGSVHATLRWGRRFVGCHVDADVIAALQIRPHGMAAQVEAVAKVTRDDA
jgi:hypothetical protein